jgi:hypothetical protein
LDTYRLFLLLLTHYVVPESVVVLGVESEREWWVELVWRLWEVVVVDRELPRRYREMVRWDKVDGPGWREWWNQSWNGGVTVTGEFP